MFASRSRTLSIALSITLAIAAAPLSGQTTAIVGATVIDGRGDAAIPDAVVVVEGDRLACVGPASECAVPSGAEVIDGAGTFVTPGLVDAHVHFSQTGWLDGRPDGLTTPDYPYAETIGALEADPAVWQRSYLCSGITAVFDVGGHPWTTRLPDRFEGDPAGTHIRTAGPLITHANVPALQIDDERYTFLPMGSEEEARAGVRAVASMGSTAAKVWYLGGPPARHAALDAAVLAAGDEARALGLDLIVHATGLREAKAALRAGAFMLVHSVENQFVDEEFLDLLLQNGTVYAPTLTVGANWSRAMSSVVLDIPAEIDDPNGCVDAETRRKIAATSMLRDDLPAQLLDDADYVYTRMIRNGRTQAIMAENLRRVHAAGGLIATATDAGNPMTLHGPSIHAEMEAMQAAGIPADEVVVMSTANGARAMRRADDFGTLEAGRIADLLILDEDPTSNVRAFRSIRQVMRAGVIHEVSALGGN